MKYSYLRLIAVVFICISCTKTGHLLPEEYQVKKTSEYDWGANHITEFKIEARALDFKKLEQYPLDHPGSVIRAQEEVLVKWINFSSIDPLEQDRIQEILNDIIAWNKLEEDPIAINLIGMIERKTDVLFAGHGRIMIGSKNSSFNFYEYMYLLNLKEMTLFEIRDDESHQ